MLYVAPALRLKVEANLAGGSPLYVLVLDGLSIVGALRELSWQLAVALSECFLTEQEYAARLIEVLSPLAATARLLPPGAHWRSHATIRLRTETRMIEDGEETEEVALIELRVNDLEFSFEELHDHPPRTRAKLLEAYEEERTIIRALDDFSGDGAALLKRLNVHFECGATLAKAQLFQRTASRARTGLYGIYSEDPIIKKRADELATWLVRLEEDHERFEESVRFPAAGVICDERKH